MLRRWDRSIAAACSLYRKSPKGNGNRSCPPKAVAINDRSGTTSPCGNRKQQNRRHKQQSSSDCYSRTIVLLRIRLAQSKETARGCGLMISSAHSTVSYSSILRRKERTAHVFDLAITPKTLQTSTLSIISNTF